MTANYLTTLQKKPNYAQYKDYHWADYIELICLANIDGEKSKMDILDRLSEREEDLEEGNAEDISDMESLDIEGVGIPSQRYKRYDHWVDRIDSWYQVLESRESLYGDSYPFIVVDDDLVLYYDPENINHKYYFFLLLCSNLYLLDSVTSEKFSAYYEIVSYEGLRQILPNNFEVELFGTNSLNTNPLFGSGITCLDKIKNLALILNEELSTSFNPIAYPSNNFGDAGLDVIAYLDTGDNQPSGISIFGQCACTTKWIDKQSTSDFSSWANKIDLTSTTINTIFIPFCFRNAIGEWFNRADIRLSFLVDRSRLISFLNSTLEFSEEIKKLVEELIITKEEIF